MTLHQILSGINRSLQSSTEAMKTITDPADFSMHAGIAAASRVASHTLTGWIDENVNYHLERGDKTSIKWQTHNVYYDLVEAREALRIARMDVSNDLGFVEAEVEFRLVARSAEVIG